MYDQLSSDAAIQQGIKKSSRTMTHKVCRECVESILHHAAGVPNIILHILYKMQVLLAVIIISLSKDRSFTLNEQAKVPRVILFHCLAEPFRTIL